jgi:hypothetical protein
LNTGNAKSDNLYFGTRLNSSIVKQLPPLEQFQFLPSEVAKFSHLRPSQQSLLPTSSEAQMLDSEHCFPSAPAKGYHLEDNLHYHLGFVYVADYDLDQKSLHLSRLLKTITPPNVSPELVGSRYVSKPIPSMIQIHAGIPFAFRLNSDNSRIHTIACLQTLDSLQAFDDYDEIKAASVRLAKLTWGCPAYGNTPEIPPIYELQGLKENDRSMARASWKKERGDGSYNLSSTVMKGDGQGTVLPAIQANTPEASSHILPVLQLLHEMRRRIMPKSISKFEQEITDFHSEWNNVVSSGGLEPNATSVQMNVSSLNCSLQDAIGSVQGQWHVDQSDDRANWTLMTMLLRVGPGKSKGHIPLPLSETT